MMRQQTKTTIESKVADTILEKSMELEIGGVTFEVAPPTTATLILVSELVSQLPAVNSAKEAKDIVNETLRVAKDCQVIAEIPAVILLGAANLKERRKTVVKRFFGLVREETESVIDRKKEVAELLLNHLSPQELNQLTVKLLMRLEIGDFFGFTTSLSEINLLKPTKEVGMTTTASGQS